MEKWRQRWVQTPSQLTYLKGIWRLEDGKLRGSCADYGAAYTGLDTMGDAEITCVWQHDPARGRMGFAFGVQGAIRGYALLVDGERGYLCKQRHGYRTLAVWERGRPAEETAEYTVRLEHGTISVFEKGKPVVTYTDTDQPWLRGMTGFVLEEGGHALFTSLRTAPCPPRE